MGDEVQHVYTPAFVPQQPPLQPIQPMQPVLTGLLQAQAGLTDAVNYMANIQAAHMRAAFESMPLAQRDVYCQQMQASGVVDSKMLEQITGKSYSTVNRHLNGKNS